MVGDICGLHAQVMSAAELAAAVRLDGLRAGTVTHGLRAARPAVAERSVAEAERLAELVGATLSVTLAAGGGGFDAAPGRNNLS